MTKADLVISEETILLENPLYAYRIPLAILGAILISLVYKQMKFKTPQYFNMVLVPLIGFILSLVIIELISSLLIPTGLVEQRAKEIRETEEKFFGNLINFNLADDGDDSDGSNGNGETKEESAIMRTPSQVFQGSNQDTDYTASFL